MNKFTYSDIESVLEQHDADMDAAEAHGVAAGMLCLDERVTSDLWLAELFQGTPSLAESEYALLAALFQNTKVSLLGNNFEFNLFLPDDEDMLSEQLEAFCSWCRGFLFGIGSGATNATWPGDSGEILKDFIEFTKLDTQSYSEGDEHALMEIQEYSRTAVMLLRDDLRGNNSQLH